VEDPDAPRGTYDHWIVWNIPPTGNIEENSRPGVEGINTSGEQAYVSPCPPFGTHRYFFKVFALDVELDLKPQSTRKRELQKAMQGHVLAQGELVGLCSR
jgi:Raf kinase inhibitor-like YbhB/YbcL family protein